MNFMQSIFRNIIIMSLAGILLSGCGGGSETGATVAGDPRISLDGFTINSAFLDGITPRIDPYNSNGNFSLSWHVPAEYQSYYATVIISHSNDFTQFGEEVFKALCAQQSVCDTGISPTQLLCNFDTSSAIRCGNGQRLDLTALLSQQSIVYVTLRICGDATAEFNCVSEAIAVEFI